MPDQDFEKAFATLAHAELTQKAPGLMPYLIGFQVVDKEDDDSRAVGVFGFKVGEQWYYGPVFWLNGKLKGFDLMYIVGQDIFVPMQEAWVNYITNRRPYSIGEGTKKTLQELGISQPDLTIFRRSPLTKSACEKLFAGKSFESWCKPAAMYLPPSDEKYVGLDKRASLTTVLREGPAEFAASLLRTMKQNTKFAEAVYQFYSPAEIMDSVKVASARHTVKKAEDLTKHLNSSKSGTQVEVIYGVGNDGVGTFNQLSADQREKLMKGDAVVKDNRDPKELSEVYKDIDRERVFQNPGINGLWKVFGKDGKTFKAFFTNSLLTIGKGSVTPSVSLIVDTENGKATLTNKQAVIASNELSTQDWTKFWDGLSTLNSVSVGKIGTIITKDRRASTPFRVLRATTSTDGAKTLCVVPFNNVVSRAGMFSPCKDDLKPGKGSKRYPDASDPWDCDVNHEISSDAALCTQDGRSDSPCCVSDKKGPSAYDQRCRSRHIKIVKAPVSTVNIEDTLIINEENAKFMAITPSDKARTYSDWSSGAYDLQLATMEGIDVTMRNAGFKKLAAFYDGHSEVTLKFDGANLGRLTHGPAITALMTKAGMSEADARDVLKQVRLKKEASVLVKVATSMMPSSLLSAGPVSTFDAVYKAPVLNPQSDQVVTQTMNNYPNPNEIMEPIIDQHAQQMATGAASKGQKEVFDMAALSGLVRSNRFGDKLEEFLKDIVIGNDRIGRILFLFYWHNDKFTDRYGDEDLNELEDLLRENFESNGKLVLFLKQKSVEPAEIASEAVVNLQ